MHMNHRRLVLSGAILLSFPFLLASTGYSAEAINLRHANLSTLKALSTPSLTQKDIAVKEIGRSLDAQNTLHVRMQETYAGFDIWGADAVMHIPNGAQTPKYLMNAIASAPASNTTMNGLFYKNLTLDLGNADKAVFTEKHADLALQRSIANYQHQVGGTSKVSEQKSTLMVYIDDANKAHWAYKVSFRSEPVKMNQKPAKPVYIMDAKTFQIYANWDDVKNLQSIETDGGGFGGNKKMGKVVYDGTQGNLAKLLISRDANSSTCFLQNSDVTVRDVNTQKVMSFTCKNIDDAHNQIYWSADFDAVNGGYSPGNDALFGGQVIKHMYKDWYGMPVLKNADGSPMMLKMVVHYRNYDNAYWDGEQMTFGDGEYMFYPLTSLGVAAHEISHGFTEQHSNLNYYAQSGGMNEAYSDMAAQAAEVYAYGAGKNSWQIGPEIFKAQNEALRYMDKPSKDCERGKKPGDWCSIDDASQYKSGLDVHFSSGVYNRFFYKLGTTAGWDAKKAFDLMVHTNANYWTSNVTFSSGACDVISAAKALKYDVSAVKAAFDAVKVKYNRC